MNKQVAGIQLSKCLCEMNSRWYIAMGYTYGQEGKGISETGQVPWF